jgi:hypothetical protein
MIPGAGAPRDLAAWNINAEQSKFISELNRKAWLHYLQGDFDGWFWYLSAVRENINHDLTKGGIKKIGTKTRIDTNERKELDDLEVLVARAKSNIIKLRYSTDLTAKGNARHIYIQRIRDYSRRVGELLKQLGYLPPKEDRTKLSF